MAEQPQLESTETTDVFAEDDVVHVPAGVEELADSQEHASTFLPDVPNWDEPDQR
jgi:hypothetical protein